MPGSREGIGGQYSSAPMYNNQNVQSMQIDAENAYSSAAAPSSDKQRESVIMRQEQEFMEQERSYAAAGDAEVNMAPT